MKKIREDGSLISSQAQAASKVQDAVPKATISIQLPAPMGGDSETTRHGTEPAGALQIADVFLMKVGEKLMKVINSYVVRRLI